MLAKFQLPIFQLRLSYCKYFCCYSYNIFFSCTVYNSFITYIIDRQTKVFFLSVKFIALSTFLPCLLLSFPLLFRFVRREIDFRDLLALSTTPGQQRQADFIIPPLNRRGMINDWSSCTRLTPTSTTVVQCSLRFLALASLLSRSLSLLSTTPARNLLLKPALTLIIYGRAPPRGGIKYVRGPKSVSEQHRTRGNFPISRWPF